MHSLDDVNLPQSVRDMVQFYPYEDIVLAIFARGLPDVPVKTYFDSQCTMPAVTAQRFALQSGWSGDPRFIDSGLIRINVFTRGPDAELQGVYYSEAIRVLMLKANLERWHFPGIGSVLAIDMQIEPTESADWATTFGPVQFPDLPKDTVRYETVYRMTIRRP